MSGKTNYASSIVEFKLNSEWSVPRPPCKNVNFVPKEVVVWVSQSEFARLITFLFSNSIRFFYYCAFDGI